MANLGKIISIGNAESQNAAVARGEKRVHVHMGTVARRDGKSFLLSSYA
jgi:hypothetical protein